MATRSASVCSRRAVPPCGFAQHTRTEKKAAGFADAKTIDVCRPSRFDGIHAQAGARFARLAAVITEAITLGEMECRNQLVARPQRSGAGLDHALPEPHLLGGDTERPAV